MEPEGLLVRMIQVEVLAIPARHGNSDVMTLHTTFLRLNAHTFSASSCGVVLGCLHLRVHVLLTVDAQTTHGPNQWSVFELAPTIFKAFMHS